MLCDYTYYKETYHGSQLPETLFAYYMNKAEAHLARVTFGRASSAIEEYEQEIKRCLCSNAETLYMCEERQQKAITSEKLENWSVTYDVSGFDHLHCNQMMNDNARLYLGNTGLMYCGVE